MTDLVVSSLEPWDSVWRRNQHLVSRLLLADPGLRVLFVEPPFDPLHDLRRGVGIGRSRGLRAGGLAGADGRLWLFQPTKWLPRRWHAWTDRRLAGAVQRTVGKIEMTDPALWINDPASAEVLRRTSWPALYDVTDDWLAADRPARELDRLRRDEDFLLAHCRHVVVCSDRLLKTKRAAHVTLVPNGVDVAAYAATPARPEDLPPHPTALYVGTLHRDRLDVDLCVTLARSLGRTGSLVLLGPIALDERDQSRLEEAGAILMGAREHTTVPAYLMHADALVVPHVVTPFTDSLDPIKVYEYLASRRPVVSTPVAGFRDLRYSHVRVVRAEDFAATVSQCLREGFPHESGTVNVPSWTERAEQMSTILADLGVATEADRG